MNDQLVDRVADIVSRELRVPRDSIDRSTTSADVENWDSLGHLQVCMAIEGEFGLTLELDLLPELDSVEAIVRHISSS